MTCLLRGRGLPPQRILFLPRHGYGFHNRQRKGLWRKSSRLQVLLGDGLPAPGGRGRRVDPPGRWAPRPWGARKEGGSPRAMGSPPLGGEEGGRCWGRAEPDSARACHASQRLADSPLRGPSPPWAVRIKAVPAFWGEVWF